MNIRERDKQIREMTADGSNVALMIIRNTDTGAVLSSDYLERKVNEAYFIRVHGIAIMTKTHADAAGLGDGCS